MSNLPSRRRGSNLSRSQRENRAFQLAVVGGGAAVVAVIALVLSIVGVIGSGLFFLALVVAGMMSSMCVDATVRAAVDLGFSATVIHDACAAPDLEFGGDTIPGRTVHGAFMAALSGNYATLVAADDVA